MEWILLQLSYSKLYSTWALRTSWGTETTPFLCRALYPCGSASESSYLTVVICEILVVLILATSLQLGSQCCGVCAVKFPEITWQSNCVSTTASFISWCCFLDFLLMKFDTFFFVNYPFLFVFIPKKLQLLLPVK